MGLVEDVEKLKEKAKEEEEAKQKKKKFRLPWGSKVGKKQAKKNWVTIMKINENGFVNFEKQQIEDQTVMVDGIPRLATPEYSMYWKGTPMLIIPNWSVKPISPNEEYQKSLTDGSNTKGYKILLAKMSQSAVTDAKKKLGGILPWIIGIGLAALIGYALMTGGGKIV